MELLAGALLDWKDGFIGGGWSLELEGTRIVSVRPSPRAADSPLLASPGLIQGHVHLCQTLFRGMAEGLPLLPWLETRIWPLEASHTEETMTASAVLSLREMVSSGCTGLLDMGAVEGSRAIVDVLKRSGVRALAGNTLMDTGPSWIAKDIDWLIEESRNVRAACGGLVGYAFAPRFALSCSGSIWEWLASEARGLPRTTHAAETECEMEEAGMGPPGGNIRFLEQKGFLGRGAVLAHCIHLAPGEAGILAGSETRVAHCPWANLRLGSGVADVPALAGAGVGIVLGSDGAACNNGLDLAADLRLAMALASVCAGPSAMPTGMWFRSVTQGAAEALGWGNVGRLAPGFEADVVTLELSALEREELAGASDPLRFVLELPWPSRVRSVRVAGRELYRDGDFPTLPPAPAGLSAMRAELAASAIRFASRD
jgi:cytosine/adenosine deaminase-related metal-dependent hydrolase